MGQQSEIAAALMILIGYYSIVMIGCIVQSTTKKKPSARGYSHQRNEYSR